MQDVKLKVPGIDRSGALRHPAEGPLTIDDVTADRWRAAGLLDEEAEYQEADEDGLDGLKVEDLKKIATEEAVDLGAATTKPDIIAAIRAHRAGAK